MTGRTAGIESARELLRRFGFVPAQSNERSALVLLALLGLTPGDAWEASSNRAAGVTPLMTHIAIHWGKRYAPNSRETIRRQTLHQFIDAGLVELNHDDPQRAINSKDNNYRITPTALTVIEQWGQAGHDDRLADYLEDLPGQLAAYEAARALERIPVSLPSGAAVTLSPGGQNILIKQMVEEFCPRFTPGGHVLYLGDADGSMDTFDEATLATLGVAIDHHGKLPDLVVYMPDRNWMVLLEAASSHGPVDAKRHGELKRLFKDSTAGLVFVSCFPSRVEMRRYLADLAWETEVWIADTPDHLVHFNGERFLGPYGN